jgi:hypothetical protein
MTLDEAIAIAKKVSEDESADARGRKDYRQIAEWLEELKQYREQNQAAIKGLETNLDHYLHEILKDCMPNLAVVKGKPKQCNRISCCDCEFRKDQPQECHKRAMKWLKQQYIKPTYELSKFEFDLLQSCPSKYMFKYIPVLGRMKEKGYFKGVDEDATTKDILADCDITEED